MSESEAGDPAPQNGREAYFALTTYSSLRASELGRMFAPVIEVTDAYGALMSRVVWELADTPPRDQQDRTARDLLADAFDFLLAWRRSVLEGQLVVGYPLARRAFESLSLLVASAQDASLAQRWYDGKQIRNAEIRKKLASLPTPESEPRLKELYAFFSLGAHPNRDLIPMRFLGEGNGFVLGSIGAPHLVLVTDHLLKLLSMWFWFCAFVGYHYRVIIDAKGREWGNDYLATAARAKEVAEWLEDAYNQLLAQEHTESDQEPQPPGSH